MKTLSHQYALIVAGGEDRLWTSTAMDLPREMQVMVPEGTLIEEIYSRFLQLLPADNIYISTTQNYEKSIKEVLTTVNPKNIIVEPTSKGPATAYAIATEHIYQRDGEAIIFGVSSDKVISKRHDFQHAVEAAFAYAAKNPDSIMLAGTKPHDVDTEKGYIKVDKNLQKSPLIYSVEKFVEKPIKKIATSYIDSGDFYWSLAYYCYHATTLRTAYDEADAQFMKAVVRYVTSDQPADFELINSKPHEIEFINTHKFPLRVILFKRHIKYVLDSARQKLLESPKRLVHIILIATKPDIIKQAPLYLELRKRGELVLLCHTGQHYDFRYSGGMMEEFGIEPDILLDIDGGLHDKIAQMIERFGEVIEYLQEQGKTPIPYIHGDTSTSMAIGLSAYMHRVACVHVEAGIRTLTPKPEIYKKFYQDFKKGQFDWGDYYKALRVRDNFQLGSREPFPEQFNTRVSEPASGYHAVSVELVKEFVIAEGFSEKYIEVVGNTVADATRMAIADSDKSTIFDQYPQLKKGKFIRLCIHRRENTQDEVRFTILVDAMEKMVRSGRSVLLISLFGTETAIDQFGLRARMDALQRDFPDTFIYSEVWPYYRDVIAAMRVCSVVATDSGSMQEEMNILGVPCVTLRFGSDRGESIIAGANILAPPIDSDFIVAIIEGAMNNQTMAAVGNIYGNDVSKKIVDGTLRLADDSDGLFHTEERRLAVDLWSLE